MLWSAENTVIAESIAVTIAESTVMTSVTIADSIRSNGITYRIITDYCICIYILLNYCMTPQSCNSTIRVQQ